MSCIDAAQIAEGLGGKRSGDGYRCNCPVHGGKSGSSFSIRDGRNGPLVKCFGGCSQTEVIQELRSRGLWPDATPEQKKFFHERKRQKKIEKAELVLDIAAADQKSGKLLCEADRAAVVDAEMVIVDFKRNEKPVIQLKPGTITQVCDQIEWGLSNPEPTVFNNGGILVSPCITKRGNRTGLFRISDSVVLHPMDSNRLGVCRTFGL